MLSVSCFGTCRIHNPIAKLAKKKLIKFNNGSIQNYLHSTEEILQQINFIEKKQLPHKSLWNLIFDEDYSKERTILYELNNTSTFLVEISSKKVYKYKNYVVKPYIAESILKNLDSEKKTSPPNEQWQEIMKDFVENFSFKRQTLSQIKKEMCVINSRLPGKVIFVTHINVVNNEGKILPVRQQLIELVEEQGKILGLKVFNPTDLIIKYGQSVALENKGQDLNHYTSLFFEVLGYHLFENYL